MGLCCSNDGDGQDNAIAKAMRADEVPNRIERSAKAPHRRNPTYSEVPFPTQQKKRTPKVARRKEPHQTQAGAGGGAGGGTAGDDGDAKNPYPPPVAASGVASSSKYDPLAMATPTSMSCDHRLPLKGRGSPRRGSAGAGGGGTASTPLSVSQLDPDSDREERHFRYGYNNRDVSVSPHLTAIPSQKEIFEETQARGVKDPWPPGSVMVEPTGDWELDLTELKEKWEEYLPLMPREFVKALPPRGGTAFLVIQFNMLADMLSGAYLVKPDAKSFKNVPLTMLGWKYRGLRVVEEILRYDADIICLQECDQDRYIQKYLEPAGYDVHFQAKVGSPNYKIAAVLAEQRSIQRSSFETRPDGVLIALRRDVFRLSGPVQRFRSDEMKTGATGLAFPIQHQKSNVELMLFTTHLKATKTAGGEEKRVAQLHEFHEKLQNPKNLPLLMCCDMNANPKESQYGYSPDAYELVTSDKFGLTSAYVFGSEEKQEPAFTSYKKREGLEEQHTIDYIFFKNTNHFHFNVTELLSIPDNPIPGDDPRSFLPAWNYPSDHFALGAAFELVEADEKEQQDCNEACCRLDHDARLPWPPGSVVVKPSGDIVADLERLKPIYPEFEPLMPRKFQKISEPGPEMQFSVSILQFNMLADTLSGAYLLEPDGKSFLHVSLECLSWKYRGLRVVEEILRYGSDIICLQECDQDEFLRQYLEPAGYEVYFQEKVGSPCFSQAKKHAEQRNISVDEFVTRPDGVVVAFRKDHFCKTGEILKFTSEDMESGGTGLVVPIRHKESKREFLVFNTHLKATKTEQGEKKRVAQLLEFRDKIPNAEKRPIIMCCDLNANPVKSKYGYEPEAYEMVLRPREEDGLGLQSVYRIGSGDADKEPAFTSYKKRDGLEEQHTIDYIFFRDSPDVQFQVTELLDIPENTIPLHEPRSFLPAWNYPSDHFAIGCRLAFQ